MELSISILNSKDKEKTIKILNNTNISYFHIDIMDGIFVSQKSLPLEEVQKISKLSEKKLDIHLMTINPLKYIEELKKLPNIDSITIHEELDEDVTPILSKIKEYGFKRGISVKPNTHINSLIPYLNDIDKIIIMTVEPGLGGQPFLDSSIQRIKEIKKLIKDKNILLEVDGGINNNTIKRLKDVDISVVGSYVTTSNEPIQKIKDLLV